MSNPFKLSRSDYKMKPNHVNFENAVKKIQKILQEEENRKKGRKARNVSYAFVTNYIYNNYLRGKTIK
jgi:hypothetical protein